MERFRESDNSTPRDIGKESKHWKKKKPRTKKSYYLLQESSIREMELGKYSHDKMREENTDGPTLKKGEDTYKRTALRFHIEMREPKNNKRVGGLAASNNKRGGDCHETRR